MTAPDVHYERIPEYVVTDKRLGRHVHHDPRSLNYPVEPMSTVSSRTWTHRIPILDQGNVGSCTGNAATGALGTNNFFGTLSAKMTAGLKLDEPEAVRLYTAATKLDPYPGSYPQQDTGSDGLSVAKAAKNAGLIAGYVHATSITGMNAALQKGPVIIGINWYDSFDTPNPSTGRVSITPNAVVRGGHEVCVRAIDTANRLYRLTNSWSINWGLKGEATFSWDDMNRLFGEQGDCTQFLPLAAAAVSPSTFWSRLLSWLR